MSGDWHTQALDANPLLDKWDYAKAFFRPGELVVYVGRAAQDHRVYAWTSVALLLLAVPMLVFVWLWLAFAAFAIAMGIVRMYFYGNFRGYRVMVADRRLLVFSGASPMSLDYEGIRDIEVAREGPAGWLGFATLRVTASEGVVSIKAVRDADQAAQAIRTAAEAVGFQIPITGSAHDGASN